MKRTEYNGSIVVCELCVGEHLKRVLGLEFVNAAYDYEVIGEYPHHYVIRVKYIAGLGSDKPTIICTSVSKASIFCGRVVLIKQDGSKVRAHAYGWNAEKAS